eukprot:GEMP01000217.1.p1 GENE.GEMP01000217.1~~GEMP01000217.1.p1  ORF type:complete len:2158 (+),score=785.64 GEMP01000217.1:90-6563(+)
MQWGGRREEDNRTMDVETLRQERDALRQEKEDLAVELCRFAKRHDEVLDQLQDRGAQLQKLHSERFQAQQDKVKAEGALFPVQRQKERLEDDKKFLEEQLSLLSASLATTQTERDNLFTEKTSAIFTLRLKCETYHQQLHEMGATRDLLAIQHAKVADDSVKGVNERRACSRDLQLQIQTDLENKERECEEALRQKASLEADLKKVKDENAELKSTVESLDHAKRRAAAPLEVGMVKVTAELETAKTELAKMRKEAPSREEEQRAMAAMRENEARMIVTAMEAEKKLTKTENLRQRAYRDALKLKSQVDILEGKLTKSLSHIAGQSVVDLVKQNAALEAKYRCLLEENDEKESERIDQMQKTFGARQAEFDAALAGKQAEIADCRVKMEDIRRERNSFALELQQLRSQPQSAQPEMDKLLREFCDAKRNLQHDKDSLEAQVTELRKHERELLEQTDVDRERIYELNQKYTSVSMAMQAQSAKNLSQSNVIRHLEKQKHEHTLKIQKLQEQGAACRAAMDEAGAQHRLLSERLAASEREQKALQSAITSRQELELHARNSLEERTQQFQLMLERLKSQHLEEVEKLRKQEEIKLQNQRHELDFAKQEVERLEARTAALDRELRVLRDGAHRVPRPTADASCLARLNISKEDETTFTNRIVHLEDLVAVRTADARTTKEALDALQVDMNRLQEQHTEAQSANGNLRARVSEMEAEEKRLKDAVRMAEKWVENHKERSDKSLRVARMSVGSVAEMKRLVATTEQRVSDVKQENAMLTKVLERHKMQSVPGEQQRTALVEELTKLREEKRLLHQQYRNENIQMRQQLANCEPQRVEALEYSIANSEEELNERKIEIAKLMEKCAEQHKELETLGLQLSLKEKTVEALQNQLSPDAREALESMEADCLRQIEQGVVRLGEVEIEQREAGKMRAVTAAFENTLHQKENLIEHHRALVVELRAEREKLLKSLDMKDAVASSAQSLEIQLREARDNFSESMQEETERGNQREERIRALHEEVDAWSEKFNKEAEKAQEAVVQLRSSLAQQEVSCRQIQALEQTVMSLENVRKDQDTNLRTLHSQLITLQSEKSAVEMEKALSEEKIASLTRTVGKLVSEKGSFKEVEAVFRLGLENAANAHKGELEKRQKEEDEQIQALKERIAELDAEMQNLARNSDMRQKVLAGEVSREKEVCAQTFEQKLTEEQSKHAINIKNLEDIRLKLELELVGAKEKHDKASQELLQEKLDLDTSLRKYRNESVTIKALLDKERAASQEKEKRWTENENRLQARIKQAQEQAAAAASSVEKQLQDKINDVQNTARQAMATKERSVREVNVKIKDLELKEQTLRAEKQALQTDYDAKVTLLSKSKEMEATLHHKVTEKEKYAKDCAVKMKELAAKEERLRVENEKMKADIDKHSGQTTMVRGILNNKSIELRELNAKLAELESKDAQHAAEKGKHVADAGKKAQQKEQDASAQAQKDKLLREKDARINELELAEVQLRAELQVVANNGKQGPACLPEKQVSTKSWQAKASELEAQVLQLRNKNEKLVASVKEHGAAHPQHIQKEPEISARDTLVVKEKALKSAQAQIKELEQTAVALRAQNEKLSANIDVKVETSPEQSSVEKQARKLVLEKNKELREAKAKIQELNQKLTAHSPAPQVVAEVKEESAEKEQALHQANAQIKELQMQMQNADVGTQLGEARLTIAAKNKQVREAQCKIEKLQAQLQHFCADNPKNSNTSASRSAIIPPQQGTSPNPLAERERRLKEEEAKLSEKSEALSKKEKELIAESAKVRLKEQANASESANIMAKNAAILAEKAKNVSDNAKLRKKEEELQAEKAKMSNSSINANSDALKMVELEKARSRKLLRSEEKLKNELRESEESRKTELQECLEKKRKAICDCEQKWKKEVEEREERIQHLAQNAISVVTAVPPTNIHATKNTEAMERCVRIISIARSLVKKRPHTTEGASRAAKVMRKTRLSEFSPDNTAHGPTSAPSCDASSTRTADITADQGARAATPTLSSSSSAKQLAAVSPLPAPHSHPSSSSSSHPSAAETAADTREQEQEEEKEDLTHKRREQDPTSRDVLVESSTNNSPSLDTADTRAAPDAAQAVRTSEEVALGAAAADSEERVISVIPSADVTMVDVAIASSGTTEDTT